MFLPRRLPGWRRLAIISAIASSPWFGFGRANPDARITLLCVPRAGGGASGFREWWRELPDVEVQPVQLPGRETRFLEPPWTSIGEIVDELASAAGEIVRRPFAVFGHSMGALIGYELVRALRARAGVQPTALFVAAAPAPHLPRERAIHGLSDAELVAELRRLEGTPDEVLRNPELLELMLPIVRADFTAIETYVHAPGEPLDCPIRAFGGTRDEHVSSADLAAWRELTRAELTCTMIEGDHFFVQGSRASLLAALRDQL